MFKIGDGHQWRHEISGQFNGRPFTAFEYRYGEGAGRMRTAYTEAMMHWRLTGFSLPKFTMVPAQSYLFRIGKTPGMLLFRTTRRSPRSTSSRVRTRRQSDPSLRNPTPQQSLAPRANTCQPRPTTVSPAPPRHG